MGTKKLMLSFLLLGGGYLAYGQSASTATIPDRGQVASAADSSLFVRASYEIDLKTNLIYDATSTFNLGIEIPLARRWSLDVAGNYNPWTFAGGRKWKHWMVQPEFRFWTKERQSGHFIGIHALGGVYNVNKIHLPYEVWPSTAIQRYEGWGAGAGLTYGYRWNFSERWGMEGQIGLGYIYTEYDTFCPENCGLKIGSGSKHYFGPTKIALNLIYRFGKKKRKAAAARYAELNAPRPVVQERIMRDTIVIRDTVTIRDTVPVPVATPDPRIINESYTLRLQYEAGSSKIVRTLADNGEQLSAFKEFIDRIYKDPTIVVQRITLTGYCSIEGTAALNDRLSYARANNIKDFLLSSYPWMNEILSIEGHGEDWRGLLHLVEESDNTVWKNDIEWTILNLGVYEGREKKLMELYGGDPYRWMFKEFFPELRRVECNVEYTIREE